MIPDQKALLQQVQSTLHEYSHATDADHADDAVRIANDTMYGLAGGDNIDIATKKVSGTTYYVARPVYVFGGDGNDDLDVTGASAGSSIAWPVPHT